MRNSRKTVVVAAIAAAVVALPSAAWAAFTGVTRTATTVSSARLAAPTSVTTTKSCTFFGLGSGDSLTVSWTATATSAATGYTLVLDPDSGTTITKSIAGRTTTSATIPVKAGSTYSITVSSVLQNWTATSTAVSAGCGWFG